eukprot:Nitzschia sp. Nitz4//scaffold144_size56818//43638//44989//NITZ4_006545-RA/size56818-processed-gene-0.72-mRNA-1//1//CDS//3329536540//3021//frame0
MKNFLLQLFICLHLLGTSHGEDMLSCPEQCQAQYSYDDTVPMLLLCTEACENSADKPYSFDAAYPYVLGPLPMAPRAELTYSDPDELANLTGTLYARVDKTRQRMQFWYEMDHNPEPMFPYHGMHLHKGNLVAGEIGGHILVSIAGKGPVVGCAVPVDGELVVCSETCLPGSVELGTCMTPASVGLSACPLCNLLIGDAYFCRGGCQGDGRILGHNITLFGTVAPQTVVPSRKCDIDNENPSNALQGQWIQGVHSHEYSGNPDDGEEYSPYSIGVAENFDLWCGDILPFLIDEVFGSGQASYVALHGNFNATGISSLVYGDAFAAISTSEGGPQSCYLFGNTDYPCDEAYGGLPALSPPMINTTEAPSAQPTLNSTTTLGPTMVPTPASTVSLVVPSWWGFAIVLLAGLWNALGL